MPHAHASTHANTPTDAVGLVLFQVISKFLEGKPVTGPNVMAGGRAGVSGRKGRRGQP